MIQFMVVPTPIVRTCLHSIYQLTHIIRLTLIIEFAGAGNTDLLALTYSEFIIPFNKDRREGDSLSLK